MKQVIIIGAGDIGERAFKFIGAEFVAYFADNKKCGQIYNGKQVLPVKELKKYEAEYIFLLAVSNHLSELKVQLERMEIEYFYFREEVYYGNAIYPLDTSEFTKMTLYECVKKYFKGKTFLLGKRCSLISKFISQIIDVAFLNYDGFVLDKDSTYILDEIDVSEYENLQKVEKLYRVNYIVENTFRYEGLFKYKDCHKGKRCFLIGNGPSLRIEDLEKIHQNGDISIGLNVIHKLYGQTNWRPDYICVSDMLVIMQNYNEIIKNNQCELFISDVKTIYNCEKHENENLFHEIHLSRDGMLTPYFADDIVDGIYNGSTVSYIALQICVYMGFEDIYLLGMDCSNWDTHFQGDYWKEGEVFNGPNEKRIFMGYLEAKKNCEQRGVKIFNATRGGKLEVFERVDFETIF